MKNNVTFWRMMSLKNWIGLLFSVGFGLTINMMESDIEGTEKKIYIDCRLKQYSQQQKHLRYLIAFHFQPMGN